MSSRIKFSVSLHASGSDFSLTTLTSEILLSDDHALFDKQLMQAGSKKSPYRSNTHFGTSNDVQIVFRYDNKV